MEELQGKQFGWYMAIFGAIAGWFLQGSKVSALLLDESFQIVLFLLALYGALLCILFIYQKASYVNYVARLRAIEKEIALKSSTLNHKTPFLSVFQVFLSGPALLGSVALAASTDGFLRASSVPCIINHVIISVLLAFIYLVTFVVAIPERVSKYQSHEDQDVNLYE
jgi:hypothetical protein